MTEYANQPTKPVDQAGFGRAWKITAPDAKPHQRNADCGMWLVHAPHGHPFWSWYVAACVNLRPTDGAPAPHIQFPGATHEVLFLALSPDHPLPDVDRWGTEGTPPMVHLEPVDLCHQVILPSDDAARELLGNVVSFILAGQSPDSDFHGYWQALLNRSSEHLRLGGHPR